MKKRLIALLLLLALAMTFAACADNDEIDVPPVQQGDDPPVQENTDVQPKKEYHTLEEYFAVTDSETEWVGLDLYGDKEKPAERLKYGKTDNENIDDYELRYEDIGIYLISPRLYYNGIDLFPGFISTRTITFGDYIYTILEKEERSVVDGKDYVSKDTELVKLNIDTRAITIYDEQHFSLPNGDFKPSECNIINPDISLCVNDYVIVYGATGGIYAILQTTGEKKLIVETKYNYDVVGRIVPLSNNEFLYAERTPEFVDWYSTHVNDYVNDNGFYYYVDLGYNGQVFEDGPVPPEIEYFVSNMLTGKIYSLGDASASNKLYLDDEKMPAMLEKYQAERDADLKAMGK